MTEEMMHAKLRCYRHRDGSPVWSQENFVEKAYNTFQGILLAADRRRGIARFTERRGQQDVPENATAILDNIVARDPERYLAWLSTLAYFHFMMYRHNSYDISWEEYCAWEAPGNFELCCQQASAVTRPPLGPGAIDRTKYGPPGDRPTITLEEAKKGYRRGLEFQYTADGPKVCLDEKDQYSIIHGKATSREAAAHYHAIRGEDVWLFEPVSSVKETFNESNH